MAKSLSAPLCIRLPQELVDDIFNFTIAALRDDMLGQATFIKVEKSYQFPKLLHLTRQLRLDHIAKYFKCDSFLFAGKKVAIRFLDSLSVKSRSQIRQVEIAFKEDPQTSWRRKYDQLYWPQRNLFSAMIYRYERGFWRKVKTVDYERVRK